MTSDDMTIKSTVCSVSRTRREQGTNYEGYNAAVLAASGRGHTARPVCGTQPRPVIAFNVSQSIALPSIDVCIMKSLTAAISSFLTLFDTRGVYCRTLGVLASRRPGKAVASKHGENSHNVSVPHNIRVDWEEESST